MLNDKKIMSFIKPVSALADRPRISPNDLKAWFDSNSTKECKEAINAIIDSLVNISGANEIGASVIGIAEQTVFGVLTALKTLIDDRYTIIQTDNRLETKFDKTTAQDLVKTITIDTMTGLFTVTKYDGTVQNWDTALEKVALDARLEGTEFVLTLADGTEQRVELSAFIDTYTFLSTATISATTTGSGNNKQLEFAIREGSITREMMNSELLNEITGLVESASASAARASKSEQSALTSKNDAGASASNAFTSETKAKQSELNTKLYEENAHKSETNALISASNSEASAVRSEKAAKIAEEIAGKDYLTPSMIVNNLTDGGVSVPLSAEMGKALDLNKADKTALAATDKALGELQTRVDNIEEFVIDFTLLASGWSASKTYTITEPRITSATEGELVEGTNSDVEHMALAKACISRETVLSAGQLVISARGTIPSIDINVKLKVRKF